MSCIGNVLSTNPCCSCIKLRIATAIIAGIEIIISTVSIVIYSLSLATVSIYETEDAFRNSGISTFLKLWDMEIDDHSVEDLARRLFQIFAIGLVLNVINFCIGFVLAYATKKRNIKMVRIWIVFKALGISLCIIYLLTTIFLGQLTAISFLLDFTEILVIFYFLWVVYAFMKELVEEQVLKMSPSIIHTQGKIDVSFPL